MRKSKLPERFWNSQTIQDRLYNEACFEGQNGCSQTPMFWAVVPEADDPRSRRTIVLANFEATEFNPPPHELQQQFGAQLMIGLNTNLSHDGVWIVGFTHPPGFDQVVRVDGDNCWYRMIMMWLDSGGDPQFVAESEVPFVKMVQNGQQAYLEMAEKAWQEWNEIIGPRSLKDDFGVSEGQVVYEALENLH